MADILASNATSEVPESTRVPMMNLNLTASILRLVVTIIVVLVGVPGNCLILRVYWVKLRKTSTHSLVMALSWADLAVCILKIFPVTFTLLLHAKTDVKLILDVCIPFVNAAVGTSVLVTGLIAVDRYDCICRPQRRLVTPRRAKILIVVASLSATIGNAPDLIAVFCEESVSAILKATVLLGSMFSFGALLVGIAVCYGKVFCTVRKHVRVGAAARRLSTRDKTQRDMELQTRLTQHVPISPGTNELRTVTGDKDDEPTVAKEPHSGSRNLVPNIDTSIPNQPDQASLSNEHPLDHNSQPGKDIDGARADRHAPQRVGVAVVQRQTTKMLFITSVVFLLTWLPYWVYVVMKIALYCGANINLGSVSLVYGFAALLFVNNATNPFIYGLANRRFRKDCKRVLSKIRCC